MGMISEFKDFAMKGNLVDLAVGFILGGAFGTLVSSMVNDIIMPVVGKFSGGVDFSNMFINLGDGEFATMAAAEEAGAPIIKYGLFINNVISFVILALVLFFIIKAMNKAQELKKKEELEAEAAAVPANEVLLAEIRDLLKK